jgi:hypothetical protein
VKTALLGATGIISTRIIIITIKHLGCNAQAPLAMVTAGARIGIGTVTIIGFKLTPECAITSVIGTGILVVACHWQTGLTDSIQTTVIYGTDTSILAGSHIVHCNTSGLAVTTIIGTQITVIAVKRGSVPADSSGADFANGTCILVITG